MAYIGTSPSNGVRRKHTYTATAGQTSFSGNDDNVGWKWHLEKRHNDAYAYQHLGSVVLAQSLAIDRIKLFKSDGAEFSNYGYTLYKVIN